MRNTFSRFLLEPLPRIALSRPPPGVQVALIVISSERIPKTLESRAIAGASATDAIEVVR